MIGEVTDVTDDRHAFERLVWALAQLPDLVEVMRGAVTPSIAYAFGEVVSGGGDKHTIPVRGDVLDDLDALWGQLDDLLDEVADKLGYQTPPHARAFGAQRRRGGASGTNTPGTYANPAEWRTAALAVKRWVEDHGEQIRALDLDDTCVALTETITTMRSHYQPRERPHWWHTMRQCEQCMERAVGVTWEHSHLHVACLECGHEVVGAHDPMRTYWESEYLAAALAVQAEMMKE